MACLLPVILRSIIAQIDDVLTGYTHLFPPVFVDLLKKLKNITKKIEDDTKDAIGKSTSDKSTQLLMNVMNLAYEADDVFGEFRYELLRTKAEAWDPLGVGGSDYKLKKVGGSTSIPVALNVIDRFAERVGRIMQKFAVIGHDTVIFRLDSDRISQRSITHSVMSDCIVGRKHEKDAIINLLFSSIGTGTDITSKSSRIHVLPIVGLRGLGKTTVAQMVYNDFRVHERFDLQGWIYVSDNFSVETITYGILESFAHKPVHKSSSLIVLQAELSKVVEGRSFFLVLDDLWNENSDNWKLLLSPLHFAQSGVIVATTCNKDVARVTRTMPPFLLKCLPSDDSWSMFRNIAFKNMNIVEKKMLETGKRIVARCKGLPGAINQIAHVLSFHHDEDEWMKLLSPRWNLFDSFTEEVLRYLRICYDQMPLKLKQCFLFFTLYPKDSTFYKDDLVRLWSACGLLEEIEKDPEDAGSILLEELQMWLNIETVNTDYGANIGYIMDDIMHELAMFIAKYDFTIVTHYDLNFARLNYKSLHQSTARYLSIIVSELPESPDLQQFCGFRALRVLQVSSQCSKWNNAGAKVKIPEELFVFLNHLRSLILRNIPIEALPDSIGNLKLLQYLDLTNTSIESIPEPVCNLYNLQKLEITNCPLRRLPDGLGNLISLRYLIFNPCLNLPVSHGMERLTNLKTLSRFEVQKHSSGCNLYVLKDLVNLRKLYISGLYKVTRIVEATLANLSSKRRLNVLRLDWSIEPSLAQPESPEHGSKSEGATHKHHAGLDPIFQEKLLENLKPHSILKELHVHNYCGSIFPSWFGDASFTVLVKVSLIGCGECCKRLPSLGQLPSLENLAIQSMGNLCRVGREFFSSDTNRKGFLSLKTLEFVDMVKWSAWDGVQSDEFCSLNTLRIVSCPELVALPKPLSSSLTKLIIKDCDTLARIPNIPTLAFLILAGGVSENIFTCLNLPMLRSLKVSQSRNIRSINCKKLPLLEVLVISGCRNMQHVFGLNGLLSLKILKLTACEYLQFSLREKLPSTLVYLDISYSPKLQQWKEIHGKSYYEQLCKDASDEILKKFEELREAEFELMIPSEEALNIELSRSDKQVNQKKHKVPDTSSTDSTADEDADE